jgi:hypothetical protein
MSKRLMLSVPALSLAALACMDAYAGCIGTFCSTGFNRSGSPAGDLIAPRGAYPLSTNNACPGIFTVDGGEGGGEDLGIVAGLGILQVEPATSVRMTLAGTVPTFSGQACGLDFFGNDEGCNVRIAVDCTDRVVQTHVPGPFRAEAPGFNQVNFGFGPDVANFTFKLAPFVGDNICANSGAGPYRDWSLREAFYEACVNDDCLRELCRADMGGGRRQGGDTVDGTAPSSAIRPWHCTPIATR